jgi:hypothetical protein
MAKRVGQPQKAKKKKKNSNGFWAFGGSRTTPKGLGVVSAHPKSLKLFFFFFFFLASGGGTTPLAMGNYPQIGYWVTSATQIFFFFNIFPFLFFSFTFFKNRCLKRCRFELGVGIVVLGVFRISSELCEGIMSIKIQTV